MNGSVLPSSTSGDLLPAELAQPSRAMMREVFETLDRLGVRYYLTGSEALARCGEPRQTMDVDVMVDLVPAEFPRLARAFEHGYYPEMPESWFRDVVEKLAAMRQAGKWHGLERP